jgi:alcohol dehydrogenase (cytochrome c)
MTPTACGIVFFGNMDIKRAQIMGPTNRRAIGGGVITYAVNGTQKIAVAKGLTTAKVSILGL